MKKERTTFWSNEVPCVGHVYRGDDSPAHRPAIVMAHGFAGAQEGSLARTAEEFARAGFVVLTFDCRNFGESGGTPRQMISIRMQHEEMKARWRGYSNKFLRPTARHYGKSAQDMPAIFFCFILDK